METLNLIPKKQKLSRLIKAPVKLFIKARDLYVAGMGGGKSDRVGIVSVIGCPTGPVAKALPKSASVNSSRSSSYGEKYSGLPRSASANSTYGNRVPLDRSLQRQTSTKKNVMPRSYSVGIGRIDEDKSCRFDGNVIKLDTDVVYTKSKSYAVGRTANRVF